MCYTVGPSWLSIPYIIVCICSPQIPNPSFLTPLLLSNHKSKHYIFNLIWKSWPAITSNWIFSEEQPGVFRNFPAISHEICSSDEQLSCLILLVTFSSPLFAVTSFAFKWCNSLWHLSNSKLNCVHGTLSSPLDDIKAQTARHPPGPRT